MRIGARFLTTLTAVGANANSFYESSTTTSLQMGYCEEQTPSAFSNQQVVTKQQERVATLTCKHKLQQKEHPQREVIADSWETLMRLFAEDTHVEGIGYRTKFVFRGMADADWHPFTSLQRLGHPGGRGVPESVIEAALLRSFRMYASDALPRSSSDVEWLSFMQHHGCPTRLLDFSYSPLVALYFATEDESLEHRDGVIW